MSQNPQPLNNGSHCTDLLPGQVENARQYTAQVLEQRKLAHNTYAVRVNSLELAEKVTPGQFFMIRPASGTDPLLGRPFALYDTIVDDQNRSVAMEFAYHVVGKMTRLMTGWEVGQKVVLWGPLGNGFPFFQGTHLLCVGGGIGYTPFLAVGREALGLRKYGQPGRDFEAVSQPSTQRRVSFCYGVQSKPHLADLSDFDDLVKCGLDVQISSDDGSVGHRGFVTELVGAKLALNGEDRPDGVFCCGPKKMMKAVAELCAAAGVPCWLSLETPMACGFGACFSCVTKVRTEDGWDYRRTCVEGPIFRADELALNV